MNSKSISRFGKTRKTDSKKLFPPEKAGTCLGLSDPVAMKPVKLYVKIAAARKRQRSSVRPDAPVRSENMETTKSLCAVFEQDGLRRKHDQFSGARWQTCDSHDTVS